eukprot:TRINITY_DN11817_c0_g2_i1.p1 TRINITY_DN11817_c0_g2~~TRINITY_DN11817_c0_g2_i1.p1  ORF type:complete len:590 (+),score=125.81 TRINITY_DN11817_c0_g2_i1:106-1875(+)
MGTRQSLGASTLAEVGEATMDGVAAAASRSSGAVAVARAACLGSWPSSHEVQTRERQRIEQELENDRRFFADPPDDYIRCPTCSVVYAVNSSRHSPTPESGAPMIPACYSKELSRGANLVLDEALRHLQRCRFRCAQCGSDFCRCGVTPYHWGWSCDGWQRQQQIAAEACPVGSCRWCAQPCMERLRRSETLATSCCGSDVGTDLKRFPPSLSCAEKERRACGRRLACGHWCGGVRGEETCPPCLHSQCRKAAAAAASGSGSSSASNAPPPVFPTAASCAAAGGSASSCSSLVAASPAQEQNWAKLPDSEDWCPICWTETLGAAPVIQLECGHFVHHHCAQAMVRRGITGGRRLAFKSIKCAQCQAIMQHPSIKASMAPMLAMYKKVRRKALQRWVVEQRGVCPRAGDKADEDRVANLAMQKMTFYECSQCAEPYYGGEVQCAAQDDENEELDEDVQAALAMELVCRGCSSKGQRQCHEHGTEFLAWKCRYCCEREAQYFCFGTTHFCHVCHEVWQSGMEQRRKLQAGRICLGKDRCILGGRHPPGCRNGRDEYALGCSVCAQDADYGTLAPRERKIALPSSGKSCSTM